MRNKMNKYTVYVICCLLLPAFAVFSHPHVFVSSALKFNFSGNTLSSVTVYWTFDDMFSNQIVMACDTNKNNRFEPDEIKKVEEGFFVNLENHGYFTFIWHNNNQMRRFQIKDFSARIVNNQVEYTFSIPMNIRVAGNTTIKMMFQDDSNFVAYFSEDSSITINGNPAGKVLPQNNRKAQFQVVVSG